MASSLADPALLKQQAFIDGTWCDAASGARQDILNPADGKPIASVPLLGPDEARTAILSASRALPGWRHTTALERSRLLRKWFELVRDHREDLATLITLENGKPLAEARAEVDYGAAYIEWFAEEAKRIDGTVIPQPSNDRRLLVIRQPVGVCAAITPWNFPVAMITRKVAPALAAGCTMVHKPALQTPLSALALAELARRAGIPGGVFNVVTGEAPPIGEELATHPLVRKLTFTGSTPIGKLLMKLASGTVKKVTMELGGNAPFIVFDDADLDAAIEGLLVSKFRHSGQTCVCANRILVQAGVLEAFTEKVLAAVKELKVGNGLDQDVTQGPLISPSAVKKVDALVQSAQREGATILAGGKSHALGGAFYEPTVLSGVTMGMEIAREEIFGPVVTLIPFKTEEEAVAMANDTDAGLASYFYTRDVGRIFRVAEALEYGMAGVNTGAISNAMAPFGGVKESGLGREGSKFGIEDYLVMKYICLAGLDG
jgi:succinate-semialdehyde dehydrogenase/glutarate-semialdehyde dehydrogenase